MYSGFVRLHRPFIFFFNDTATTEIYTLSLHDALPISESDSPPGSCLRISRTRASRSSLVTGTTPRSEEHTSELQSPCNLVCRLLLEKKKVVMNCHAAQSRANQNVHMLTNDG